ncbi:HalOD1 output domain-containing protein [Halobaculum sp. EA56]|uniref:HalOD1 output domain-containing protein n=1 Tax=Halobaculum sp. EA56 TaxID=3421648 RepID=UPI003EC0B9BE
MGSDDDGTGGDVSARGAGTEFPIDDGVRPSEAVVRAVAEATDTPVLDLPPLYGVIDPEHLDELIDGRGDDAVEERSVSFRFGGCRVTVNGGTVRVRTASD